MKYRVVGADATTGQDVAMTIEAKDARSAEEAAAAKQIYIRAVMPDPDPIPPPLQAQFDVPETHPASPPGAGVVIGMTAIAFVGTAFGAIFAVFGPPQTGFAITGASAVVALCATLLSLHFRTGDTFRHLSLFLLALLVSLLIIAFDSSTSTAV